MRFWFSRKTVPLTAAGLAVVAIGASGVVVLVAVLNAIWWRALPGPVSGQLVFISGAIDGLSASAGLIAEHADELHDLLAPLAETAIKSRDRARIGSDGLGEVLDGEMVSANYFDVVGIQPTHGRTFLATDDIPTAVPVMVISDELWKRVFGGSPSIVGQAMRLHPLGEGESDVIGRSYTVIGVMPHDASGLAGPWRRIQYWVPVRTRALDYRCWSDPMTTGLFVSVGRLRPGATVRAVQSVLTEVAPRYRPVYSAFPAGAWKLLATTDSRGRLPFDPAGRVAPQYLIIAVAMIAISTALVAVGSLATVLNARLLSGGSTTSIRLVLGATRTGILMQAVIEACGMSVLGGAVALLVAHPALALFEATFPAQLAMRSLQVLPSIPIDLTVIFSTTLACIVVGFLTVLVPAIRSTRIGFRVDVSHGPAVSDPAETAWLRIWIIAPQLVIATTLSVTAGPVALDAVRREASDPGYDARNVSFVQYWLPGPPPCRYTPDVGKAMGSVRAALASRVRLSATHLPGTYAVATSSRLPFDPAIAWVRSRPDPDSTQIEAGTSLVSDRYFLTLGVPVIRGRTFNHADMDGHVHNAVVSRELARRLWQDRSPIGRELALGVPGDHAPPRWLVVIGEVGDTLDSSTPGRPVPWVFLPDSGEHATVVMARNGHVPAERVAPGLATKLQEIRPSVRLQDVGSLQGAVSARRYPRRLAGASVVYFGAIALALANISLYAVVSHALSLRHWEFGIRVALGASPFEITWVAMTQGLGLAGAGAGAGLFLGTVVNRVLSAFIPMLPTADAILSVAIASGVVTVAGVACYLAARRITRIQTAKLLRLD